GPARNGGQNPAIRISTTAEHGDRTAVLQASAKAAFEKPPHVGPSPSIGHDEIAELAKRVIGRDNARRVRDRYRREVVPSGHGTSQEQLETDAVRGVLVGRMDVEGPR